MSISLTNETKNSVSLTMEDRDQGTTWDAATYSWDAALGTWNVPGVVFTKETKNSVSLTFETEN